MIYFIAGICIGVCLGILIIALVSANEPEHSESSEPLIPIRKVAEFLASQPSRFSNRDDPVKAWEEFLRKL